MSEIKRNSEIKVFATSFLLLRGLRDGCLVGVYHDYSAESTNLGSLKSIAIVSN